MLIAQDWIRTSTRLLSPAPQAGASAKFRHLGDFRFMIYYFLFTIVPALVGTSTLFINNQRLSILRLKK